TDRLDARHGVGGGATPGGLAPRDERGMVSLSPHFGAWGGTKGAQTVAKVSQLAIKPADTLAVALREGSLAVNQHVGDGLLDTSDALAE
ncbi:MAG: hypothetical protein ACXVDA_04630, partial [Ktedonobacterales bacterium]